MYKAKLKHEVDTMLKKLWSTDEYVLTQTIKTIVQFCFSELGISSEATRIKLSTWLVNLC